MDTDALIKNLASELGVSAATLRVWRHRGSVPHRRRDDIRELATHRGFIIPRGAFDNFGRISSEAA